MKLTYQNNNYRVRFTYSHGNDTGGKALENLKDKKDGDEWKPFVSAWAIRNPNDNFSKAAGRKVSLTAALKQIQDRNIRRAFWTAYFLQHRDGRGLTHKIIKES
jgi:hypothetical protein